MAGQFFYCSTQNNKDQLALVLRAMGTAKTKWTKLSQVETLWGMLLILLSFPGAFSGVLCGLRIGLGPSWIYLLGVRKAREISSDCSGLAWQTGDLRDLTHNQLFPPDAGCGLRLHRKAQARLSASAKWTFGSRQTKGPGSREKRNPKAGWTRWILSKILSNFCSWAQG